MPNANISPQQTEVLAIALYEDALATGIAENEALKSVLSQLPAAAEALLSYAATGFVEKATPKTDDEDILAARIQARSAKLFASRFAAKESAPVTSILDAAKKCGLDIAALSRQLAIGKSVLVKLDRRLIDPASIGDAAAERIAGAIGQAAESVRQYLSAPPTLSAGASYRSNKAPSASAPRQSLSDALDTAVRSGEITEADAREWRET